MMIKSSKCGNVNLKYGSAEESWENYEICKANAKLVEY